MYWVFPGFLFHHRLRTRCLYNLFISILFLFDPYNYFAVVLTSCSFIFDVRKLISDCEVIIRRVFLFDEFGGQTVCTVSAGGGIPWFLGNEPF